MNIERFIWDLDDDPYGNVQHLADHGLTVEEVEESLLSADEILESDSSGLPLVFGETSSGKVIAVVFELVDEVLLTVRVVTAFEVGES